MAACAATPAISEGPSGTRFREVRCFREVDSTNMRLAELARVASQDGGDVEGTVVVAEHQSAGRGRRGRSWEAPPGSSLLVSVLIRVPAPELAQLTTVCAALAAAEACLEVAGLRPSLKWPNDIMVGDNKLGGILAEAFGSRVVVGLGLNVDWGDHPLPEGATSLTRGVGPPGSGSGSSGSGSGPGIGPSTRRRLLTSYLLHLDRRCRALDGPRERTDLLEDYRRACSTLGRAVRVDLGNDHLAGLATDIADNGSLVVTTDSGAHEIAAGDVVHLNRP